MVFIPGKNPINLLHVALIVVPTLLVFSLGFIVWDQILNITSIPDNEKCIVTTTENPQPSVCPTSNPYPTPAAIANPERDAAFALITKALAKDFNSIGYTLITSRPDDWDESFVKVEKKKLDGYTLPLITQNSTKHQAALNLESNTTSAFSHYSIDLNLLSLLRYEETQLLENVSYMGFESEAINNASLSTKYSFTWKQSSLEADPENTMTVEIDKNGNIINLKFADQLSNYEYQNIEYNKKYDLPVPSTLPLTP